MKEIFGGSFSLAGTGNIVSKIPIYIYNDFEIIFNYICGFVMTYMKEVAIFDNLFGGPDRVAQLVLH